VSTRYSKQDALDIFIIVFVVFAFIVGGIKLLYK